MKKLVIAITVLGVLALLAYVLYITAMGFAFQSFGRVKEPPPLFVYQSDGRVERMENAIQQVVAQDRLTDRLANGNRVELHHLTLMSNGDNIEYQFYVADCQSFYFLAKYKDEWDCAESYLHVLEIKVNGVPVIAYTDKKINASRAKTYHEIFEKKFFSKVKAGLEKQPSYEWKSKDVVLKDTNFILIDIYRAGDTSSIVTRHVFANVLDFAKDTVFRQISTERYFGDTSVLYLYDTVGGYIEQRKTFVKGKFLRQDY